MFTSQYITCKHQVFHLHHNTGNQTQETYTSYQKTYWSDPENKIDLYYLASVLDTSIHVQGVARTNNSTMEKIIYQSGHESVPTQYSSNTWGCLVMAIHARRIQAEKNRSQIFLHVPSTKLNKILNQSRSTTHTATTCYIAEWEIFTTQRYHYC